MATVLDTLVTKISFMIEGTPLESLVGNLNRNTVATEKLGTASVETSAKMKKVPVATKEAGVAVEFFNEQMKHLKSTLKDFAGIFLGIEVIKESIEAVNDMKDAMAQVQAGLKSTGDAAGLTSDQLEEMAEKLQSTSTYNKADILKNVTAQLLTFKNISGETFDRAQQDIIDYAARSGRSLNEISIQIGRALNNPAQALGVLSRVGIQFNKEQTQMIDGMVKSGHAAEAQAYMLQYLETSFKGSAQAAADTGSGPLLQFKNNLIDLAEVIGGLIEDVLNPLLIALNKTATFMRENSVFAKIFAASLGILTIAIYGVRTAVSAWAAVQAFLDTELAMVMIDILVLIGLAALLALAIQDLWVYFHGGDSVIGRLIDRFEAFIEKHQELKAILGVVGAVFTLVWSMIKSSFQVTVKFIEDLIDSLVGEFKMVSDFFSDLSDQITGVLGKIKSLAGFSSDKSDKALALENTSFADRVNSFAANINAAAAVIGGNASQGNSVTNNSHAPVTNVNLTVNANGGDANHIGTVVTDHLTRHFKNAARAYDSGIAS